jgi:hypothetical protein
VRCGEEGKFYDEQGILRVVQTLKEKERRRRKKGDRWSQQMNFKIA